MKKKNLLPVILTIFLVSCGGQNSSTEISSNASTTDVSTNTSKNENTSSSQEQSTSTLNKLAEKIYEFYKVDSSYQIYYNDSRLSTSIESKSVYIGKDDNGYDSKVEFFIGYITKPSSLDNNANEIREEYSYYYSPTKTYEKLDDGTYKVTNAEHDIKPYNNPFDFSTVALTSEVEDGYSIRIKGSVSNDKIPAFFGKAIKDSSKLTDLSVSIDTDSSLSINSIDLEYKKGVYNIKHNFTFDIVNSKITLPSA